MKTFDSETEEQIAVVTLPERFISNLKWNKHTDEYAKSLVDSNIREFYGWLYRNEFLDLEHIVDYITLHLVLNEKADLAKKIFDDLVTNCYRMPLNKRK